MGVETSYFDPYLGADIAALMRPNTTAVVLEAPGSELLGKDAGVLAGLPANGVKLSADLWSMSANADGILDFTVPAATIANVAIAAERGLVHVIGTTGLSPSDDAVIRSVTDRAIVVKSGNMSLGVNLLAALVKRVAQSLDQSFDIEILELHHKQKIDAPSGTALMLGEAAAAGRKIALEQHSARGRDGLTGARRAGDIGFASLRGGTAADASPRMRARGVSPWASACCSADGPPHHGRRQRAHVFDQCDGEVALAPPAGSRARAGPDG